MPRDQISESELLLLPMTAKAPSPPATLPVTDDVLQNLIAGRALIDTPEKHCKQAFRIEHPQHGLQLCSLEALHVAVTGRSSYNEPMRLLRGTPELRLLEKAAERHKGYYLSPACAANNAGHGEAMAMWDRAIAARKSELSASRGEAR